MVETVDGKKEKRNQEREDDNTNNIIIIIIINIHNDLHFPLKLNKNINPNSNKHLSFTVFSFC